MRPSFLIIDNIWITLKMFYEKKFSVDRYPLNIISLQFSYLRRRMEKIKIKDRQKNVNRKLIVIRT